MSSKPDLLSNILTALPHRLNIVETAFLNSAKQTHQLRARQSDTGEIVDGIFIYRVKPLVKAPAVAEHSPLITEFFKEKAFLDIMDALDAIMAVLNHSLATDVLVELANDLRAGRDRGIYSRTGYPLTIERHYVFLADLDTTIIPRIKHQQVLALAKVPAVINAYVQGRLPTYVQLLNMLDSSKRIFDWRTCSKRTSPTIFKVYETHYKGTINDSEFDTTDGGHIFTSLEVAANYINRNPGMDGKLPDTGDWLNCTNGKDWWVTQIVVCCDSFATAMTDTVTQLRNQLNDLSPSDLHILGLK